MSETAENLGRKIESARKLKSVARTMKALAAASITQYEVAVRSLAGYYRTVELGLVACLRDSRKSMPALTGARSAADASTAALVFGSDQGLVGQFNERLAEFAAKQLRSLAAKRIAVWTVGERVRAELLNLGFQPEHARVVPTSVTAITPLVAEILLGLEERRERAAVEAFEQLFLFHNAPIRGAAYEPVSQRLLPLDNQWRRELEKMKWPTNLLPEVLEGKEAVFPVLVREYLFVSLFKACTESLASENASRLAAMQRAERNINELAENLGHLFHQLRQSSIDGELFDLISGFEALTNDRPPNRSSNSSAWTAPPMAY